MNITTPLNRLAAFCLFILCAAAPAPAAPPDPTQVMQLDGMRVAVGPHGVLEIAADGVVFSRAAQLWLVNPTWTDHHYSFDMDTTLGATLRRSNLPGGGQRVEFDMRAPTGEWRGTQRADLLPGRVVRVAVDAQLTTDMPDAVMEHQLGEIVPGWLTGRPMEVTNAGGAVTRGTVPGAAKSDETKKNILASGFRRLALDTRAGRVEIATSGSAPMTLIDHRRNPAAMGKMVFWFGVFDIPVRPWEKLSYAVEFRFPPAVKRADAPAARVAAKPRAVDAAVRPQSVPDRVIPTPKKMEWRRGELSLAAGATVSVSADGAAEKAFAGEIAAQLRDELKSKHGTGSAEAGKPGAEIELRIAPAARGAEPHGPEEYRVEVGRRAVLEAQTTAGLANAWKTLRQLVRSGDGSPARIRRCTVHDWPSLDFRGVLFFTGRDAGADQAKLVRDILGAMKINFLLYHVNMAEWASHPELQSRSIGMSRDEVNKVIAECRRQQVEIIPFVPAFGLKEWIRFGDMSHPLAGQPLKSKPLGGDELSAVHDVMREAAELFKPRYFHIGHDELDTTTGQLLESIRIHRDFLATLGLRTMIWSDLFLYRGEGTDAMNAPSPAAAKQRREGLPKDVIVTDWHYEAAAPDEYRSLAIFNAAGLDTIACPWDNPRNIVNITREALRLKCGSGRHEQPGGGRGCCMGVLDTTWAGWNFDRKAMEENAKQVAAWIVAAEAAWTGGARDHDALPFDHMAEFIRIWNGEYLPDGSAPGWVADLNEAANFDLAAAPRQRWLGFHTGESLASLPAGEQWLGRFRIAVPGKPGAPRAVLLGGRFNPPGAFPRSLRVPVETTASAVTFALAATFPGPGDPAIARSAVRYADGTSETIAWRLGQNVFSIDDPRITASSPVVFGDRPKGAMPRLVHAFTWINPAPAKEIREITFESADTGSALMLFGMGGVQR